ncbi:hypothetical protein DEO72_LG8g2312 [Vigna unguiculata]|uniref:Uncharacterized protein n=1 Tax=Vigna unguiculata TaxID=3917 RepID=A0A4D6MWL0_VIGUN|nr:hypothetical protein DEO72_LG8g2312 [Vigna unguiculata]
MSNQQQTPVTAYPVDQSNLTAPPPPVGYPTKDGDSAQQTVPVKTTTRGDGFWKGWVLLTLCWIVLLLCFGLLSLIECHCSSWI